MRGAGPLGALRIDAVAVVAQDVAHMPVLAGAERERDLAGGIQAIGTEAFGESEKSEASAVAMLGGL